MRKSLKQIMRKSLCGVLCTAMLFSGVSVPELSAYAAESERTQETESSQSAEESGSSAEMTSEESVEAVSEAAESSVERETLRVGETQTDAGTGQTEESKVSETASERTEETNEKAEIESENRTVEEVDSSVAEETASTLSEEEETSESQENSETEEIKVENSSDENVSTSSDQRIGENQKEYIVGGDFEELGWEDGKLGDWNFSDAYSEFLGSENPKTEEGAKHNGELGLGAWYDSAKSGGTLALYQTLNLPKGSYTMTAFVKETNSKTTTAMLYQGESGSEETSISGDWTEITYNFVLDTSMSGYEIGLKVTSEAGAWVCIDDVSLIGPDYTLEDLNKLYDEVKGYAESDYTAGWADFDNARKKAEELINANSTDNIAIIEAYTDLSDALSKLEGAPSKDITFKELKDLLASEQVTAIIDKGENAYTSDSWKVFHDAKVQAEKVIAQCEENNNADDYASNDITLAYTELQAASKNIKAAVLTATVYYYSEALSEYKETDTETEKHNLYLSTWSEDYISSTKDSVSLLQGDAGWSYTAFTLDEVTDSAVNKGYDNWYVIPVKVGENAGQGVPNTKDGFIVQAGIETTANGSTAH